MLQLLDGCRALVTLWSILIIIDGGNLNNIAYPYRRELNLAVGSQIAIANLLADLNLAVRYGIAIHIYASKKFWRVLIWRC